MQPGSVSLEKIVGWKGWSLKSKNYKLQSWEFFEPIGLFSTNLVWQHYKGAWLKIKTTPKIHFCVLDKLLLSAWLLTYFFELRSPHSFLFLWPRLMAVCSHFHLRGSLNICAESYPLMSMNFLIIISYLFIKTDLSISKYLI